MRQNEKSNEKKVLALGLVLILAVAAITLFRPLLKKEKTASDNSLEENNVQYPAISSKEFQEKIRNAENVHTIDIRQREVFAMEHIVDSVNIPLDELENGEISAGQDDLFVLTGYPEKSSQVKNAVDILQKKGFKNITVLSGSVDIWKKDGVPLISSGDPNSFTDQAKVTFISPEDAKKFLDEKRPVYFLDVRDAKSFSPHITGAINIPLEQLEKRRSELPVGKEIIVYGSTEMEGFQAGVRLYDLNALSAYALKGGFSVWKEKGFPAQ